MAIETANPVSTLTARRLGFRVYRPVTDQAQIQAAQELLIDEFGDAIEPWDDPEYLGVQILARKVVGAAVARQRQATGLGAAVVMNALQEKLSAEPESMAEHDTRPRGFGVSVFRTENAVGRIWLRFADGFFYADRKRVSKDIDAITGQDFDWGPHYRATLAIASLRDETTLNAVRNYELNRRLPVHVGSIALHRNVHR